MNAIEPVEVQQAALLPAPRAPRYESLTIWRGVACLCVVVYHSIFAGYGLAFKDHGGFWAGLFEICQRLWIGVPFFFVISGYCVTASADALRRREKPGAQFFWRRFRRIYPPYWIWLGLTALSVWLVERFIHRDFFAPAYIPNPTALNGWQWLGNLTLTQSWSWHLTGGVEAPFLPPSWSLCYEEQFYALVGLSIVLAGRHLFRILAVITGLVVVGLPLLLWLGIRTEGLFLDGYWLLFAAGVLAYYVLNYAGRGRLVWYCLPIILGGLFAAGEPHRLLRPRVDDPNQSYLAGFLFTLLIIGLHRWDQSMFRARLLRPLVYCGEMCYSLYLVHWPTVTVVSWFFNQWGIRNPAAVLCLGLPLCVAVAVVLARAFHVLVERRFLNPSPMKTKDSSAGSSDKIAGGAAGSQFVDQK